MSAAVQIHSYLLYTLLNENNKRQVLAVLETLDVNQVSLITEIFHNLVRLPQSDQVLKLMKTHKKLLNKLSSVKLKSVSKVNLVRKHKKAIYKILFLVRKKLMQLLK